MLGAILKYVGRQKGERYHEFIGAVGYVTSYTKRPIDQSEHVAITWFKPVLYRSGGIVKGSHFSLDRFEVLSAPDPPWVPP
jgi:hypothetical protein